MNGWSSCSTTHPHPTLNQDTSTRSEGRSYLALNITPWGRLPYLRTPMSHCLAQDGFTKRLDNIVADVFMKLKCVDNTFLYDKSIADAFWHTYQFLSTCTKNRITLCPDKFQFYRQNATLAGYLLDWEDYRPSQDLISGISSFQMPPPPLLVVIQAGKPGCPFPQHRFPYGTIPPGCGHNRSFHLFLSSHSLLAYSNPIIFLSPMYFDANHVKVGID